MEVTNQDLVQFLYDVWKSPGSHLLDAPVYFTAFLDELLSAGFPLHSELAVPTFGTVVCKAQEIECFRLSFSGLVPIFCDLCS